MEAIAHQPNSNPYELPAQARELIFNFNYPLASVISKEDFEINILRHFMMRRIGFETYTYWHIKLADKLNEIMPVVNIQLKALDELDIYEDSFSKTEDEWGAVTTNTYNSDNTSHTTNDVRASDTPQNDIEDVKDGRYVSDYSYTDAENKLEHRGDDETALSGLDTHTTTTHSGGLEKLEAIQKFNEVVTSAYSTVYRALDSLFLIF